MRKFVLSLALICAACCLNAQGQDLSRLKKEKQATARQIKETNNKLRQNKNETRRQLGRLSALRSDMERQTAIIAEARHKADSTSAAMASLTDSITRAKAEVAALKKAYAATLRRMQATASPTTLLSFIFSAESVEQMYRRARYVRSIAQMSRLKAMEIKRATRLLEQRSRALDTLNRRRADMLQRADLAGRQLQSREQETSRIVASLKAEQSTLRSVLKEKEEQQRRLGGQIDRLIKEEQERRAKKEKERRAKKEQNRRRTKADKVSPAPQTTPQPQQADPDRELTGSFESNRGRLLFPVSGTYTIVRDFGRQRHPELPNVYTDNNGIDIEAGKGVQARAVFKGTVSAIFRQPGFGTIVMIRHGKYITIYAGLASCSVKNGDEVAAGRLLGPVQADPDNGGRSILHFEVRREREKLNPRQWVR